MKQLLVLTGPQGSGNHLWSKIFALHPNVVGWQALLDEYWIGHDKEPFVELWGNPSLFSKRNWEHEYYVTSISVPYMNNGVATIPNFFEFTNSAEAHGFVVKFAVIGRDKNIIQMQQSRVREQVSLPKALAEFNKFTDPVFLSYELLHLYGALYLQNISKQLDFPIAFNDERVKNIIADDTNRKYIKPADPHATDDLAKKASMKWK